MEGASNNQSRKTENSGVEKLNIGDRSLWLEEQALTSKQKLEKLFTLRNQLIGYATNILRPYSLTDWADEVVDKAYLKAIETINNFHHDASLGNWFRVIVANKAKDFIRHKKVSDKIEGAMPISRDLETGEDSDREILAEDHSPNPEQLAMNKEDRELLNVALAGLTPKEREAIIATKLDDMRVREAAKLLGTTEQGIKLTTLRGMRKLKEKLNNQE